MIGHLCGVITVPDYWENYKDEQADNFIYSWIIFHTNNYWILNYWFGNIPND